MTNIKERCTSKRGFGKFNWYTCQKSDEKKTELAKMGLDTLKSTSATTRNVTFFSLVRTNFPVDINIEAFSNAWKISPFNPRFFVTLVAINLFSGNPFSGLVL